MAPSLLFTLPDKSKVTLSEYLEKNKDKAENTIYYSTDAQGQASYIDLYAAKGIDTVIFDGILDTRLAESIEQYSTDKKVKFLRVDADLSALKGDGQTDAAEAVKLFEAFSSEKMKLKVEAQPLSDSETPAVLTVSEETRRMEEMMRMYAPDAPASNAEATLVLNTNCDLIQKLSDGSFGENAASVARQIYTLALLSNRKLNADEMKNLLNVSYELLRKL